MLSRILHLLVALGLGLVASAAGGQKLEVVWPTPNRAFLDGKPLGEFVQPTASGLIESGLFGGTRSGGNQFHEGLDLKPINRDRQREATDPIFVVMKGVVRHISRVAGNSSYGRYVVVEHPGVEPAVYTLYAHLASIAPGLAVGQTVEKGQTLGIMGRSAAGYAIPKERAHLHFEIGFALSRNFQFWYLGKKFGSPNDHRMWNGMNLAGLDPLEFFTDWRDGRIETMMDFVRRQREGLRIRVFTTRIPDYVDRYPSLLRAPLPSDGKVGGWEISFTGYGVPYAFTPLSVLAGAGRPANQVEVLAVDEALLRQTRAKKLLVKRRGEWSVARDLQSNLELLFGWKP